jgi:hypothetical protein
MASGMCFFVQDLVVNGHILFSKTKRKKHPFKTAYLIAYCAVFGLLLLVLLFVWIAQMF